MYIYLVWLYCVTCQDFYHLVITLANIDGLMMSDFCHLTSILTNNNNIPKVYFCHLASALTNINNIPKIYPCHLAIALTNTNDKANKFTKKTIGCVQLTTHFLSLGEA